MDTNNLSYADRAFLEQLEQFNTTLNEMKKSLKTNQHKSIWDTLDEEEKAKKSKEIESKRNFLKTIQSKLQNMTDSVAETIVVTGEMLHSSKEEKSKEYKVNKLIENLDVELDKEDFNPLPIVNYMVNTTVMPTRESHTIAETNLTIAQQVEKQNKNAAKIALLNNAMIPLIVEKNINKSHHFAKAYANRDNYNIDEKIVIASIEKLKEFNKVKMGNEKLIASICRINFTDSTHESIQEAINSFKESIMKKTQLGAEPSYLMDDNFSMTNEEYSLIPNTKTDKNDIFIEFAKKYLELELPDPNNHLQDKLNELICTQANKFHSPNFNLETSSGQGQTYDQSKHLRLQ